MKLDMYISGREDEESHVKEKLMKAILQLPDNPRITRLGDGGMCFTLSSSDLGDNWSPAYHDFRKQYRDMISYLSEHSLPESVRWLRNIVRYVNSDHRKNFHPDVVANLDKLLNEFDVEEA